MLIRFISMPMPIFFDYYCRASMPLFSFLFIISFRHFDAFRRLMLDAFAFCHLTFLLLP